MLKTDIKGLLKQYLLLSFAFLLLISGTVGLLAQPIVQEYSDSDLQVRGEYIFLIDVSKSTDARATPESKSQLELGKELIMGLMDTFEGSKVQVIAYSSAALPMSDFTTNIKHIEDTLENLIESEVIAASGSNLPNALAFIARKKMNDERYRDVRDVILLSDGQVTSKDIAHLDRAINMLREQDIEITTLGVGSIVGWRIPRFNPETGEFTGEYEKRRNAEDYVSVLNERNLQILAGLTGGEYFHYQDVEEARNYFIDKAESTSAQVYASKRELLETKDIGWMFIPLIVAGLAILLFRRNLI